jgi:hypothetical protein
VNTMTETETAVRCLTLASREYAISLAEVGLSLTGMGFGDMAGDDFVGTDVQAVVGTIGWRTPAPRVTHAPMQTAKPATRTNARLETSYLASQATKQSRIFGLAKVAEDVDRDVEGTARKRIPV